MQYRFAVNFGTLSIWQLIARCARVKKNIYIFNVKFLTAAAQATKRGGDKGLATKKKITFLEALKKNPQKSGH